MTDLQLEFFPRPRPLLERFGAEFFRALPRRAGVYVMTGDGGRVLYIGKAGDLRQRLCSYKYARPAGKTWRLTCRVRAITWEICDDGSAASLRENELLRLHKPVFNVMNTRTEHYPFIGLRCADGAIELRITKAPHPQRGEQLFGAFKGLPLARGAFAALMRLLWIAEYQITSPFEIPSVLWTENLEQWSLNDTSDVTRLEDFLSGRSEELIEETRARLPGDVSRFQTALHERDVELVREFFLRGPKRNAELRSAFQLHDAVVPQVELDDLLVLRRAGDSAPYPQNTHTNGVAQPVIVG